MGYMKLWHNNARTQCVGELETRFEREGRRKICDENNFIRGSLANVTALFRLRIRLTIFAPVVRPGSVWVVHFASWIW